MLNDSQNHINILHSKVHHAGASNRKHIGNGYSTPLVKLPQFNEAPICYLQQSLLDEISQYVPSLPIFVQ
jgi:hypothetical protein